MNEKQYDHPEQFNPERYLGPSPALESPVFGFGRRACLGVHYSIAAIFITVSSILSVFDLRAQDKDGKDVQIEPAFTGGMSSLSHRTVLALYPAPLLQMRCTFFFLTPGFLTNFLNCYSVSSDALTSSSILLFCCALVDRLRKVRSSSCGVLSHYHYR